jgi:hypothetical protein
MRRQAMCHGAINHARVTRHSAATVLILVAVLIPVATALSAAAVGTHSVRLDSTMFAAQVGSTLHGGSVYAGALPDRSLGQGAIVFTTTGNTFHRVRFQEFFALGSITGAGSVTVIPHSGGTATFAGRLNITRGTGRYRHATGMLRTHGTIDKTGTIKATLKGSFSHRQ